MDDHRIYRLIIRDGAFAGKEFELEQDQVIIGRDPSADIQLEHEVVSRRHARLTRQGEGWLLEDLNSSNGTYLNGQILRGSTSLRSGDQIRLGHAITLVFAAPPPLEPEPGSPATVTETPQTVFEARSQFSHLPEIPRLVVAASGVLPQTYPLTGETMTIGRAEDNDIHISSPIMSRHHARLERAGEGYRLVVLPEVANQLLYDGRPVLGPLRLAHGDEICVASTLTGMQVSLTYLSPAEGRRPAEQATGLPGQPATARSPISHPTREALRPAGQPQDQTLIDAGAGLDILAVPPRLIVTVAGARPQVYPLKKDRVTIGRAEDNEIVIASQIVSRHHARLEQVPGGYTLVVLPEVPNPLICQGRPIDDRRRLQHGDILRLDSEIPGLMVTLVYESPSEAAAAAQVQTIAFGEREVLAFGRDPTNEVQLNVPTVSRFHARVERIGRRYRLTDLRSANGTFVNDERVEGETWLQPDDTVRIGPYRFVLGQDAFTRYDETSGLRVEAAGLNKWVRKNLNILQDISVVFQPREFIVVVGQSGGGKSTLVDAIAGYRPATHGRVVVNGVDVYRNFDAIRNEIGFVPQRDIIHMELTVYQALDYAARLRMPRDTSPDERRQRILEVLEDLDLAQRKDVQISRLSGGQQKRVSIGVELLTRPGLFFLDEPTSGLDPGTETTFMHLMRRLADQGRTIVMVTHATKNVMLADKVVFLARGGYLAWFGPPDEALAYFNRYRSEAEQRSRPMEFDQIYTVLEDPGKGSAQEWARRYQEDPACQRYIQQPLQIGGDRLPLSAAVDKTARKTSARSSARRPQVSTLGQFLTLSARNVKILTRDRSGLILMLATAPLVAMLDFVLAPLMGKAPYDYFTGDPRNGTLTLFLITLNCLLVGGLSQMREIVKETDIYRRERLVNLQILPYILSKIWVAMLLALYHALAYTVIRHLAYEMPGGALEFGLIYVTLFLAVLAGMMTGLLVSALASGGSTAPLLMIMMLIPQIVLSGVLAPVPTTVSALASDRWAFQSLIGIVGIGSGPSGDPCWALSEELRDAMTLEDKAANGCTCMGVAIFNPESCSFPGTYTFYKPEVDQPAPVEPAGLPPQPAEPVIPPAPAEPDDPYDQVAMAQYFNALQSYQEDVKRIQTDYKNQMVIYQAQAEVYEAEMVAYQETYTEWSLARNSAVKGAEGMIENVREQFGWAWVNKADPETFWSWLFKTWLAQLLLIFAYFLLILWLMKRKDAR